MSSSSDDGGDTLQERREHAVLAYELLCHPELLGPGCAWPSSSSLFKQVCDELEAIYRHEGVWLVASKKFQTVVVESTLAAVSSASSPAKLEYLGRTVIRALGQSKKLQKKHKTRSIVAYRDACIMARRRRPHRQLDDFNEPPYLPPELLAIIFGYLESPIDLARCRSVCVDWLRVIESYDDELWDRHVMAMCGRSKARELLSQITERELCAREPCPKLRIVAELAEQRPESLAPFRSLRYILVTGGSYFLRQMNEATFQRLTRAESDKALHERRYFASPTDVAAYISRPVPATLKHFARQLDG